MVGGYGAIDRVKMPLAAGAVALVLVAAAALPAPDPPAPAQPTGEKFALRIAGESGSGQTLAYYPEHLAALASIKSFQPAADWRPEPPPELAPAAAPKT